MYTCIRLHPGVGLNYFGVLVSLACACWVCVGGFWLLLMALMLRVLFVPFLLLCTHARVHMDVYTRMHIYICI